jgi:hypothetical protein
MRTANLAVLFIVMSSCASSACSPPDPRPSRPYSSYRSAKDGGAGSSATTDGADLEDDGSTSAGPDDVDGGSSGGASSEQDPPSGADGDGDGVPDAVDCDPASSLTAGTKLLDDDLATDKAFFTAASGFSQASWTYDGASYRQTRLIDEADAALFSKDAALGDQIVELRSASTEIAAITPRLRQIFILLGTTMTGGQLSALGCGVEVVQGQVTEQKTSVVRLSGGPSAMTTTPISRVDRAPLQVNEEFSIKAHLALGTLRCDVTVGGTTTTAVASNLGPVSGSVGLFTRQTKALFKQARICKLK